MKYMILKFEKMLLAVFLLGICVALSDGKDYTNYKVIEVYPENDFHVGFINSLHGEYDLWSDRIVPNHPAQVSVPPEQYMNFVNLLSTVGMNHQVITWDLGEKIRRTSQSRILSRSEGLMNWEDFQRHGTIVKYLEELAQKYSFVKVIRIGHSYEGREIKGVRINPRNSTHKIYIDGGIHAREWISPAVVTYIIDQLTTNYKSNKEFVDLFDWWIVPVTNPDGYEYSWTNDRLWRKNRKPTFFARCNGTDLNRNWGSHWMEIGGSTNPCRENYGGPSAESEPEVQAIRDTLLSLNSDNSVLLMLTFHSYFQGWMSPWGFNYQLPGHYSELEAIMKAGVEALQSVHGTKFEYGQVTMFLPPAAGAQDDWSMEVAQIRYAFTVELRDKGRHGFVLPPEEIIPSGEETWEGVKAAALKARELVSVLNYNMYFYY